MDQRKNPSEEEKNRESERMEDEALSSRGEPRRIEKLRKWKKEQNT